MFSPPTVASHAFVLLNQPFQAKAVHTNYIARPKLPVQVVVVVVVVVGSLMELRMWILVVYQGLE